jgi:hypothetical protein
LAAYTLICEKGNAETWRQGGSSPEEPVARRSICDRLYDSIINFRQQQFDHNRDVKPVILQRHSIFSAVSYIENLPKQAVT